MAAPRLRKVSSQKEYDTLVDDYITQGYSNISQGEKNTLLRRNSWGSGAGHLLWFFITVWFTGGIGNLIYALISHFNADKVMVKLTQE